MSLPKLYSRYEPTTDTIILEYYPKSKRLDVVLYRDPDGQQEFARFPWYYLDAGRNTYRHVTYEIINCVTYEVEFLGWRFTPYTSVNNVNGRVVVECGPSGWCDNPIQYDDGTIAYDFPERVSKHLKHYVKLMYDARAFTNWRQRLDKAMQE